MVGQTGQTPPQAPAWTCGGLAGAVSSTRGCVAPATLVLNIVRWIDLEKLTATPIVTAPSVQVVLKHLNPLFSTFPSLTVKLERAAALMVFVTKNGATPPPP